MESETKFERLTSILRSLSRVVVAYSGGVDSGLLLKVAHDCLGDDVLAITAASPSLAATEREQAEKIAQFIGARHILLEADELDDPRYQANPPERCYFCKQHNFTLLLSYARAHGYTQIVDGANVDDRGDLRPGQQASHELGVRSPLAEAGFTKADIRDLAHRLGLPNWNKPAAACLASRIPYGIPVTRQTLEQIDAAESFLHGLGLQQLRVRHHGQTAHIEVEPQDFPLVLANRLNILNELTHLGYLYVTLDLNGFSSGSLNKVLSQNNGRP